MPYLVRDPDYSYAYSGDDFVAIYDAGGDLLPTNAYHAGAETASRYYDRAEYFCRLPASREHRGVVAANRAARRAEIAAANGQWAETRARQAEWEAYARYMPGRNGRCESRSAPGARRLRNASRHGSARGSVPRRRSRSSMYRPRRRSAAGCRTGSAGITGQSSSAANSRSVFSTSPGSRRRGPDPFRPLRSTRSARAARASGSR